MSREKTFFSLRNFMLTTVGCLVFALAFVLFLEPCRIAPGGISALGMIATYLTGFPLGGMILLLNAPLLLLGWHKLGVRFIASTIFATTLSSFFIDLGGAFLPGFTGDLLLASLYGGLLMGAGSGLVFMGNATTGGTDILGKLVNLRFPHLRLGRAILMVDACIILFSAAVFRDISLALYAAITLYVATIVIDGILYGSNHAVLSYIISEQADAIGDEIRLEMERGVTFLHGTGAHTGVSRKVIFCAVRRRETAQLEELVERIDPTAFMVISEARNVFGYGFSPYAKP